MFLSHTLRITLCVSLVLCMGSVAFTQQPPPLPKAQNSVSPDEETIRKSVVAFVELYNAQEAKELAALFAPDGKMVLRDGTEVNGRDHAG